MFLLGLIMFLGLIDFGIECADFTKKNPKGMFLIIVGTTLGGIIAGFVILVIYSLIH